MDADIMNKCQDTYPRPGLVDPTFILNLAFIWGLMLQMKRMIIMVHEGGPLKWAKMLVCLFNIFLL